MKGLERWKGRVALVVGASSGIGEAMAKALAGTGMKVALAARRTDRLERLQAEIEAAGGRACAFACDVSDAAAVERLFADARAHYDMIDMVVNNAGVGWAEPIATADPAHLALTFDTNIKGFGFVLQAALQNLGNRPDSLIVNTSSIFAHYPQVAGWTAYHASKAAVKALTDTARKEAFNAGSRVRIAMVSPGIVATEFREKASGGSLDYGTYFADYEPLLPEDVADAVLYIMAAKPHVVVQDVLLAPMGQGL